MITCSEGYYIDNGTCKSCNKFTHCELCSKEECYKCEIGCYKNENNEKCEYILSIEKEVSVI